MKMATEVMLDSLYVFTVPLNRPNRIIPPTEELAIVNSNNLNNLPRKLNSLSYFMVSHPPYYFSLLDLVIIYCLFPNPASSKNLHPKQEPSHLPISSLHISTPQSGLHQATSGSKVAITHKSQKTFSALSKRPRTSSLLSLSTYAPIHPLLK
jgi:hypothetical protein